MGTENVGTEAPSRRRSRLRAVRVIALLASVLAAGLLATCAHHPTPAPVSSAPPSAQALHLAVIGDMPYGPQELPRMDRLLATINADARLQLAIHVGDIKGGSEPCSDEFLRQRRQQLQALAIPWLFSPGDNEWTDCHREGAGRHLPTERLNFLRSLFFSDPRRSSGPRPLAVATQADMPGFAAYVENQLLTLDGITIATLHIVGSDNNLEPWSGYDSGDSKARPRADRIDEFRRREAAALAWIDRAFDEARQSRSAAVLLAFQANPRFERAPSHADREGFNALLERIERRSRAFGRPVLLVHGDFHEFIDDRPIPSLPTLRRVQTFGSPHSGWLRVVADPAAPEVFSVEPRLVR